VEHAIARSSDPSLASDYRNLLYACRFCNRSRSTHPVQLGAAQLLDPTRDAWREHFVAVDDRLRPRRHDVNAQLTHRVYHLDDARKVERRRTRRELVTDRLRLVARIETELVELLRLADVLRQRDLPRFGRVLAEIRRLRQDAYRALRDLRRYDAVPGDAPRSCRCPRPWEHAPPAYLVEQLIEIPDS
jgi:hypothetical protein